MAAEEKDNTRIKGYSWDRPPCTLPLFSIKSISISGEIFHIQNPRFFGPETDS
jgi:hypothetical protein